MWQQSSSWHQDFELSQLSASWIGFPSEGSLLKVHCISLPLALHCRPSYIMCLSAEPDTTAWNMCPSCEINTVICHWWEWRKWHFDRQLHFLQEVCRADGVDAKRGEQHILVITTINWWWKTDDNSSCRVYSFSFISKSIYEFSCITLGRQPLVIYNLINDVSGEYRQHFIVAWQACTFLNVSNLSCLILWVLFYNLYKSAL